MDAHLANASASFNVFQVASKVASSLQVELIIFLLAVAAHVVIFQGQSKTAGQQSSSRSSATTNSSTSSVELRKLFAQVFQRTKDKCRDASAVDADDTEVLRILDTNLMPSVSSEANPVLDLSTNLDIERMVLDAALRHGRDDVIKAVFGGMRGAREPAAPEARPIGTGNGNSGSHTSGGNVGGPGRQISYIKDLAAQRRYKDVKAVLNTISPSNRTPMLTNAYIDACIECQEIGAAEEAVLEASTRGQADVVTYNTLMKAHLQSGRVAAAQSSLASMRAAGLRPNVVTFNELLDNAIRRGNDGDAWKIIDDMTNCGVRPNHITCSIMLKNVQHNSRNHDVERAVQLLEDLEEEMDEVLLSSVVEACIRASRTDLLKPQLRKQRSNRRVQVRGAHTYGSLIRAYGYMGDPEGVRSMWRELRTRSIPLTSLTVGCTVEALVVVGDTEAGHALIKEMLGDPVTAPLVNAVIYCSVLKGFSQQKKFNDVWAVYEEMLAGGFGLSIVTYNALIDCCARQKEMGRVSALLDRLVQQGIEPNLITYSTILKGYCQENKLDKAYALLDSMKQTTNFMPDEVMYNSLLDGCARQGLYQRGVKTLEDMQAAGVAPSSFTLSVVVKLAGRARKLDWAYSICKELTVKYSFTLNVHVFNNLVQACHLAGDHQRSVDTVVDMLTKKVRPDQRTCRLIIEGHVQANKRVAAVEILRAFCGLPRPHQDFEKFPQAFIKPLGGVPKDIITAVLESAARADQVLAGELALDLQKVAGFRDVDPKLKMKLAQGLALTKR